MSDGDSVSRETLLQSEPLIRFHDLLAGEGVVRGLIGPREVPRLWSRHLLNCAAVALDDTPLIPMGAQVVDVGSGAGLPGLVWALIRADLRITLVDSQLRRTTFLSEVVSTLGLSRRVDVVRGRAEELGGRVRGDVTTARAVAPLRRLLPWLAPLTRPGGTILALKGAQAESEVSEARAVIGRLHLVGLEVLECGAGLVDPPTTVVRIERPQA